jgi:DNA mismatch endonuclease (patch repair protein)
VGNKETELKLVALLRAKGITGWRRHQQIPGRPDFVFRRERLAIFVDGCFWHGCPQHCRMPQTNREYWQRKITRNATRDRIINKSLKKAGWRIIRIWGHSLRSPNHVIGRITSGLFVARRECKSDSRHYE